MNLAKQIELAEAVFGRDEREAVTRITATAVSDSADGSVEVELEDGTVIDVPVTGAAFRGGTVVIDLQDGVAIGSGAIGWGDRIYQDSSGGTTLIHESAAGILVAKVGDQYGALVSSDGSFKVVALAWSGSTPTVGSVVTNLDEDSADFLGGDVTLQANDAGQYELGGVNGGIVSSTSAFALGLDAGFIYTDDAATNPNSATTNASVHANNVDIGGTRVSISGSMTLNGVKDTSWAYLAGSASGANWCRWRCRMGVVYVELNYDSGAGISKTSKLYGTIPAGYRPAKVVSAACQLNVNNNNISSMWVTAGGEVRASGAASSTTIYGSLSYPL